MKYLKKYNNLFESVDDNILFDIADCYMDLFDEYRMTEFKLKDLPGYNGIPERERESSRPYVTIDSVNKISIPHDSYVWSNCTTDRFTSVEMRDEYLKDHNYVYFCVFKDYDKVNPGYTVYIYNKSITQCFADEASRRSTFHFIGDHKLRRLTIDGTDRVIQHINCKDKLIYSFRNECQIHLRISPYRFKKSDLRSDYSRGFISKDKFEKLMKDAV